jgi:hypothetical protein
MIDGFVKPMAGGDVGGEFVMAAAEVLDEGVPGGDDPRGPAAFQAAHRPEPGFQPPVIGLDRIIGVALNGMQRGGDQLIEDPRVSRARSVMTSAGTVPTRSAETGTRRRLRTSLTRSPGKSPAPTIGQRNSAFPRSPDPPKTCPERPDQRVRARRLRSKKTQLTKQNPIFERHRFLDEFLEAFRDSRCLPG